MLPDCFLERELTPPSGTCDHVHFLLSQLRTDIPVSKNGFQSLATCGWGLQGSRPPGVWDLRRRDRFPLPSDFTAHSAEHFVPWALVTVPPNQCGLGGGAYGHLTGNAWAWVSSLASCHCGRSDIKFVLTASLNGVQGGLRVASELSAQRKNRWRVGREI